jgi:hypothetical protein
VMIEASCARPKPCAARRLPRSPIHELESVTASGPREGKLQFVPRHAVGDALQLALAPPVSLEPANTPSISRKHLPAAVPVSIGCRCSFHANRH